MCHVTREAVVRTGKADDTTDCYKDPPTYCTGKFIEVAQLGYLSKGSSVTSSIGHKWKKTLFMQIKKCASFQ